MVENPPICLEVQYIVNGSDPDNPSNPNYYWVTLNVPSPQYHSTGQYDGTSVAVGMWTTSSFDGYVFRIQRVITDFDLNLEPTPTTVDVILEDVDGFNATIDPTGGVQGGAPNTYAIGYVFELNPLTGLPALTSVNNSPTITFPDSILGRFMYMQTGSTGGSGPLDTNLRHNLGTFAYVDGATGSCSYNPISNQISYAITIYGNSTRYRLNYAYTPTLVPNGYTSTTPVLSTIYNGYTTSPVFTVISGSPGGYTGSVNIDTVIAGGTGIGSTYTLNVPITITQADSMGNPGIVTYPTLSLVQGTPITVSGIVYYGPGSYTTISARALRVSNIYNVVGPGVFNYIVFGGSSSGSYAASTLVYNPPTYSAFPSASGLNVNYYNGSSITLTITGQSPVYATLYNAISKNTTVNPFFPSSSTGQSQTYIGYYGGSVNETTIPPNQGGTTNTTVSSPVVRMSILSSESTPVTPSSIANFNNTSMQTYDPAYNPTDGYFYASNFTSTLNSTYLLPSTATFSSGTKYLLIKAPTTSQLANVTLQLGSSATGIQGVRVKWVGTSGTYGWYNASVDWQLSGGCQNGFSGNSYSWQIKINIADIASYLGGGYIYFNVQFTGRIALSEILVQ